MATGAAILTDVLLTVVSIACAMMVARADSVNGFRSTPSNRMALLDWLYGFAAVKAIRHRFEVSTSLRRRCASSEPSMSSMQISMRMTSGLNERTAFNTS